MDPRFESQSPGLPLENPLTCARTSEMGLPNAIQRWNSKPLLGKAPQHVFTDALDPLGNEDG